MGVELKKFIDFKFFFYSWYSYSGIQFFYFQLVTHRFKGGTRFVIDTHGSILHTLRIIYFERINHFQPILNLVGATGSRGYCIPCNKKYRYVENNRCSNKCYKCLTIPQCDLSENLKQCTLCFRSFFGDLCYENHLKRESFNSVSSVCDKMRYV